MGYPNTGRNNLRITASARATTEKVEALIGERRNNTPEQQAITRKDPASLGTLALTSTLVAAAPTAADHNALVKDVQALAAVLNAMGAKITWT